MKYKSRNSYWIQYVKGDPNEALKELYQLHRDEFLQWSAQKMRANKDLAKDAFQEALLVFYQNCQKSDFEIKNSQIKTYLFQIGKFKLIDQLKKDNRITYQSEFESTKDKELNRFQMNERDQEYLDRLNKAMAQLPEDCKQLLELYYFKNYDMESIARTMGLKSANCAKSKKLDCMKKLIRLMNEMTKIFIL